MSKSIPFATGAFFALVLAACHVPAAPSTDAPPASDPQLAAAVATNAHALFELADLNHDGQLNNEEATALSLTGSNFTALDTNGDGLVSWAEFATPKRLAMLTRTFMTVGTDLVTAEDTDHDGKLSWSEYQLGMLVPYPGPTVTSLLPDPQRASFDDADADHDGYVSRAEAPRLIGFLLQRGYQLQQRTH